MSIEWLRTVLWLNKLMSFSGWQKNLSSLNVCCPTSLLPGALLLSFLLRGWTLPLLWNTKYKWSLLNSHWIWMSKRRRGKMTHELREQMEILLQMLCKKIGRRILGYPPPTRSPYIALFASPRKLPPPFSPFQAFPPTRISTDKQ